MMIPPPTPLSRQSKDGQWLKYAQRDFGPKKLRQSIGQGTAQVLGSIPEETQRTATLEDLADQSEPVQETPPSSDPATPSYSPFGVQEPEVTTAEIEVATGHAEREQGGTAATDLRLAAEQVAMTPSIAIR